MPHFVVLKVLIHWDNHKSHPSRRHLRGAGGRLWLARGQPHQLRLLVGVGSFSSEFATRWHRNAKQLAASDEPSPERLIRPFCHLCSSVAFRSPDGQRLAFCVRSGQPQASPPSVAGYSGCSTVSAPIPDSSGRAQWLRSSDVSTGCILSIRHII